MSLVSGDIIMTDRFLLKNGTPMSLQFVYFKAMFQQLSVDEKDCHSKLWRCSAPLLKIMPNRVPYISEKFS